MWTALFVCAFAAFVALNAAALLIGSRTPEEETGR
jgi:hypothetical protein